MNQTESSVNPKPAITGATSTVPEWITETINGGSLPHVDLHTGVNGWATPPGNVFPLRSLDYFTNKTKSPGGDYLLSPAGVDLLKSTTKLNNLLARPDNRIAHSLRKAQSHGQSQNTFIFAVNFQISGKEEHHSLAFYFSTEEPIPSVLKRFVDGDDTFRNQRFKLVNQVVKGPWIVKAATGQFGAFLVGKTVTCSYHRGPNYFEIDVDTGSWGVLSAFVRFMMGYARGFTVDVGLVIEAQTEEDLPERLIGAVRMCHVDLASAVVVKPGRMMGSDEDTN